ncbi:Membrane-spanning 4-domains subfamily A member 15 [Varanus komodoensis]|nr:Membrane-spanning 4-domains subfamily A member 15 [Varanus komodoensis]
MASGAIIYVPPSGGTIQAGPGFLPSSIPQQAGTVPYVQNGGQQPGGSSNPPPQNRPTALEKFLQAETKTLGAIQILIGLMHIGFGAVSLAATRNSDFIPLAAIGGYPFWGGVFFIVSGSLSVAAEKNPVFGLVREILNRDIQNLWVPHQNGRTGGQAKIGQVGLALAALQLPGNAGGVLSLVSSSNRLV